MGIGNDTIKLIVEFALSIILAVHELIKRKGKSVVSTMLKAYLAIRRLKRQKKENNIDLSNLDEELEDLSESERAEVIKLIQENKDLKALGEITATKAGEISELIFTWLESTFLTIKEIKRILITKS